MNLRPMQFYRLGRRARDRALTEFTRRDFAAFGRASSLQAPISVHGERRISIGSGVVVGAGSAIHSLGGNITLDDRTSISGNVTISAVLEVYIGVAVLIARGVYIADHSHARSDLDVPILSQGLTDVAPVYIADGAWLGQNAVILPGVRVGRNSVVGANAVVREDVPDGVVVGGVPARILTRK